MKTLKGWGAAPGIASYARYYEHDGVLRAYANRAMFLAVMFAVIALGSLLLAARVMRVERESKVAVRSGASFT